MIPLSPDQIKSRFQQALKLQSSGKLDQAETEFRAILNAAPKLAEAHFQLGHIAAQRRQLDEALRHLARARSLKPSEIAIWEGMAKLLAAKKDAGAIRAFLQEAKAAHIPAPAMLRLQEIIKPSSRGASSGTANKADIEGAIKLLRAGKTVEAEKRARTLLKSHPKVAVLHHVLGSALGGQGKLDEAKAAFENALKIDPRYVEARDLYGRVLLQMSKPDEAIAQFRLALQDRPNYAPALGNLGMALAKKGENDASIIALRQSLEIDPKQAGIRLALGTALSKSRTPERAIGVLEQLLNEGDNRAVVHLRLATAYARSGQSAKAREHYEKAEADGDMRPAVIGSYAIHLQSLGEFDAAEEKFREAIALEPWNGEHYRAFGATYKMTADDPLLAQMEEQFEKPDLDDLSRMHMGFALARAMEQIKAYDRVFTYLRPANDIMAKRYPFDIQVRQRTVDGTKAAFANTDFVSRKVADTTDYAPIFVTGMPRSGTTLVEQILSSHSTVTGTGELGHAVPLISRAMLTDDGKGYVNFDEVSDEAIRGWGMDIAAHIQSHAPDTPRATDKSIQTYMLIGAIKLAMPNARFVLVRRDPRDLLFSIYKNVFREGTHTYAYDLKTLGLYYRQFEDMVAFWREKLPGGFHEIQYEELIANPEEQSRKLLAACDLEWEDECLSFHENKRQISTLSLHQARQPIYKSSMQAWKRHEDDLAELIEALGDAV